MKEIFRDAFYEHIMAEGGSQIFYDVQKCWAVILVGTLCAIVISYAYLFIIKYLGGIIVWFSLFGSVVLFAGAGWYSFVPARAKYEIDDPTYKYLEYVAYICWGLSGVLVLAIVCCFNTIQLGVAVFKTTVDYFRANLIITVMPTVTVFCSLVWFIIWLSSAIFIFSVGTPQPRPMYPFITEISWDNKTRGVFAYHVFALLWINAFLVGAV